MSAKTEIIEYLFERRWDPAQGTVRDPVITLNDVQQAIQAYNQTHAGAPLSDRNPANFFKDFIRNRARANINWPHRILKNGYTGRQLTGEGLCFEFLRLAENQREPFPANIIPAPVLTTPVHKLESASLPLASRRLGRSDETWLQQVAVRLRVVETHLSLFSHLDIEQVDHLQMNIKQAKAEIDSLYLALERQFMAGVRELLVCCEAKGRRDDILEDQILSQLNAIFSMRGVEQEAIIPMAIKAVRPSQVHVIEFEVIERKDIAETGSLTIASEAVYEFVPPVPGIGI